MLACRKAQARSLAGPAPVGQGWMGQKPLVLDPHGCINTGTHVSSPAAAAPTYQTGKHQPDTSVWTAAGTANRTTPGPRFCCSPAQRERSTVHRAAAPAVNAGRKRGEETRPNIDGAAAQSRQSTGGFFEVGDLFLDRADPGEGRRESCGVGSRTYERTSLLVV